MFAHEKKNKIKTVQYYCRRFFFFASFLYSFCKHFPIRNKPSANKCMCAIQISFENEVDIHEKLIDFI